MPSGARQIEVEHAAGARNAIQADLSFMLRYGELAYGETKADARLLLNVMWVGLRKALEDAGSEFLENGAPLSVIPKHAYASQCAAFFVDALATAGNATNTGGKRSLLFPLLIGRAGQAA